MTVMKVIIIIIIIIIINPLNAELNPICHFLALLGAHHILHISGIRVKVIIESNTALTQRERLIFYSFTLQHLFTLFE